MSSRDRNHAGNGGGRGVDGGGQSGDPWRMAKPPPPPPKPNPDPKAEREARLATALRANLRKRKAQARAREAPPGKPEDQG
jgi:hypothetical protein